MSDSSKTTRPLAAVYGPDWLDGHDPEHYGTFLYEIATIPSVGREDIELRDGDDYGPWCVYCMCTGEDEETGRPVRMVLDHVVPASLGGTDTVGNLVAACEPCNLKKGGKRLRFEAEILAHIEERSRRAGLDPRARVRGLNRRAR